jgi:glycerol-3-phosphate dehydrogenase
MDDSQATPLLRVSSGVHLVTKTPTPAPQVGVLIPKTEDKRVLFVLPWLDHLLIGTTDTPTQLTSRPKPSPEEVHFIRKEYERYFDGSLSSQNIESAWSGLRPLVNEQKTKGTSSLSRDHSFEETSSGLLSIFGGKWTTYRLMAQETVDRVLTSLNRSSCPSQTENLKLIGAETFSPRLSEILKKEGFPEDITRHLLRSYGDRCLRISELAQGDLRHRISPENPIIWAELLYIARNEQICRTSDALFRRTRLGFLDKKATEAIFPLVHDFFAKEFGWNTEERKADRQDFNDQL